MMQLCWKRADGPRGVVRCGIHGENDNHFIPDIKVVISKNKSSSNWVSLIQSKKNEKGWNISVFVFYISSLTLRGFDYENFEQKPYVDIQNGSLNQLDYCEIDPDRYI